MSSSGVLATYRTFPKLYVGGRARSGYRFRTSRRLSHACALPYIAMEAIMRRRGALAIASVWHSNTVGSYNSSARYGGWVRRASRKQPLGGLCSIVRRQVYRTCRPVSRSRGANGMSPRCDVGPVLHETSARPDLVAAFAASRPVRGMICTSAPAPRIALRRWGRCCGSAPSLSTRFFRSGVVRRSGGTGRPIVGRPARRDGNG